MAENATNEEVEVEETKSTETEKTTDAKDKNESPVVDYDKLADIVDKRARTAENGVLKSYFKEQGLSEEEAKNAIETYKENKKSKSANIETLSSTNKELTKALNQERLNSAAFKTALELGVETKNIQYLTKMADLKNAINDKGEIDNELVKTALSTVLDDIPALKASKQASSGFKVGADGDDNDPEKESKSKKDAQLRKAFGLSK